MKTTNYIDWENLKNIPFVKCEIREDTENKDIDIYYNGELILHDYNHIGHYFETAITLFNTIRKKKEDWVNLSNLCILRNCIRENYNHVLGLEYLIFGDADHILPLTKKRFNQIQKVIRSVDKYATI